jgi:CysZ protein
MLQDLIRAVGTLNDPRVRGVLWLGIGLAIATFAGLAVGANLAIEALANTGYLWLDRIAELLGLLGTLVIAWFLFPATVVAISGFFLDRIVDAVEERYFPGLPPAEPIAALDTLPAALRLLGFSLLLNLLALPFYFVPGLNLPLWLAINGYLVGREYFELVALRRLHPDEARRLRRQRFFRVWLAGALVAFFLAIPLVNLLAPVIGAAFMAQRFQRLGGGATPRLDRYGRELRPPPG